MKRYLVKEVSTATENNPSFAGMTSVSWTGREDKILKLDSADGRSSFDIMRFTVREYGYKRKGDARRNFSYKNPQNDEMWQSTVEIVEIEC